MTSLSFYSKSFGAASSEIDTVLSHEECDIEIAKMAGKKCKVTQISTRLVSLSQNNPKDHFFGNPRIISHMVDPNT